MSKTTQATGTSPFAHLMAGFRGKRAEENKPEDGEDRDARRAEEDERRKEEDARRAEEDERRKEEDARRAEEDGDDDPSAENGDDGEGDEEQDPEKDAEDSDLDEDELDEKGKKAFRRGLALGRARENARCARIFSAPAAAGRPVLAATLAFTTRNTSAGAARIMKATTADTPDKPRGRSLDARMGARTEARPGAEGGKSIPSFGEKSAAVMRKLGRA